MIKGAAAPETIIDRRYILTSVCHEHRCEPSRRWGKKTQPKGTVTEGVMGHIRIQDSNPIDSARSLGLRVHSVRILCGIRSTALSQNSNDRHCG